MANKNVILQWNCRGLESSRVELELLINNHAPAVICLQETLLSPDIEYKSNNNLTLPSFVNFKGYKAYFKCINSGRNGIAIYVRDNIYHHPITLKTRLQALAIEITFENINFIISNHYTSDTHDGVPSEFEFQSIIDQFQKPYIMVGDFNGHNTLWSSDNNDRRGRALEKFILDNDLGLLNTAVPTRWDKHNKKWSLIDLSLIHPSLFLDFDCEIITDLHGSDHNPILVNFNKEMFETDKRQRWNFKKAKWGDFRRQCISEITHEIFKGEEDEMTLFTDKLIEIATTNIPRTSPFHKRKAKPWFDEECRAAKRERNKAHRLNRRYPCLDNAIKVKVASARAKRTFKKKKT